MRLLQRCLAGSLFMPVVILGIGAKTFSAVQKAFCLNNPDLYKRFL